MRTGGRHAGARLLEGGDVAVPVSGQANWIATQMGRESGRVPGKRRRSVGTSAAAPGLGFRVPVAEPSVKKNPNPKPKRPKDATKL